MNRHALVLVVWLGFFVGGATAQELPAAEEATRQSPAVAPITAGPAYIPITGTQRLLWIGDDLASVRSSLEVGPLATAWQTAWNFPSEWHRTWSGAGKRYLAREADVALSDALEGGLGALWGEDPRYIPAPRGTIRSRASWVVKTVFLSPRRDGHLAPAWGRYAGNTVNNLIENTYLPRSATTPGQTVLRSVEGLASRLGYNAWQEFWPDIKKRLHRR